MRMRDEQLLAILRFCDTACDDVDSLRDCQEKIREIGIVCSMVLYSVNRRLEKVKPTQVYSQIAEMARVTPERFYQHTVPECLQEQADCLVRAIIKRDTAQMALNIAKWEDEQK